MLSRCYVRSGIVMAMKIGRTLDRPIRAVLSAGPTVRWRMTLLYSALFLVCGAALLAITYWLFANFAYTPPKPGSRRRTRPA